MLSPVEVRGRLRDASSAAFAGDATALGVVQHWLEGLSGRDLLRVDGFAREFRYETPTLGKSQEWTGAVLDGSDTSAALGTMHRDGHVRERSLRAIASSNSPLSDRVIALRVGDHVGVVRELATSMLMGRTEVNQAGRSMPVLYRFEQRERGAQVAGAYLERLQEIHGITQVWETLRNSSDRDLRRHAYTRSIEDSLLDVDDAIWLLPRERDQAVRRSLAHVVADHGPPQAIREVLLKGRSAEGRALGLVRLHAPNLTTDDVFPLLADSSVLVRLWARKRWQELGGDAQQACRALVESATTPSRRARAYVALSETGGAINRNEILDLIGESEPAIQKVGLQLLAPVAAPQDVPEVLVLVRSPNSRVARLAVNVLAANLGLWSLPDTTDLAEDPDPQIRRRAWLLRRSRGGWERLIIDLEILGDPDRDIARLGAQPKAPMYLPPTDEQRTRIGQLLPDAPLKRDLKLGIAFAAGLRELTTELRSQPRWPRLPIDAETTTHKSSSWLRKLIRRKAR